MKENTTGKIRIQAGNNFKVRRPIIANLVYTAITVTVGVIKKIG